MLPLRTILHPTDFSANSEYAFRMACSLARDYRAKLVLAYVEPVTMFVYGEAMVAPWVEEDDSATRRKLELLADMTSGIPTETYMLEGNCADEILRVAKDAACDLIVMGTHGRSGLGRILMGSVAEEVLRNASCPVLTVKALSPAVVKEVEPVAIGAVAN